MSTSTHLHGLDEYINDFRTFHISIILLLLYSHLKEHNVIQPSGFTVAQRQTHIQIETPERLLGPGGQRSEVNEVVLRGKMGTDLLNS